MKIQARLIDSSIKKLHAKSYQLLRVNLENAKVDFCESLMSDLRTKSYHIMKVFGKTTPSSPIMIP